MRVRLLRPNTQQVAQAIGEVEAPPAGKFKGGHDDAAAGGDDCRFSNLQVRGVEHHERRELRLHLLRCALGKSDRLVQRPGLKRSHSDNR